MKHIGTVFFILAIIMVASIRSNGQIINSTVRPIIHTSKIPPLLPPSTLHFSTPPKVLLAEADTALAYYDPDSLGNFNWYFLPSHLTLNAGTAQNPLDTEFVINRYAERFTLPKTGLWTTRYIDSIEVVFAPVTLPTDGTTDSLIIEIRPGVNLFYQNGDTLLGFNTLVPPMDSVVISTDDLTLNQVYDTVIHLNYKLPATWGSGANRVSVGSNFFVDFYTTDTDLTRTQFVIRGDSVTSPDLLENPLTTADQDLYRGMWAILDPQDPGYPYNENDYAGLQFTNQDGTQTDYFYTNFVVRAFMSNQLTNAVDEQGNPKFILEPTFPNPVSNSTEIDYNLTEAAPVSLTVYNQLGQRVASLVNEVQSSGEHSAIFNTTNLPNGMYYYKLQSGDYSATQNMVVNK
jgi:hypothetical protein